MILMQLLLDGRDADLGSGLLPPPQADAFNGTSVALSTSAVTVPLKYVIGAPGYADGAVHVYQWNGTAYSFQTTIISPTPNIDFGRAVAISGDGTRIVVGAPLDIDSVTLANTGRVHPYKWDGNTYVAEKILDPPGGGLGPGFDGKMGQVVSMADDGHSFVAGAPGALANTGFAYGWSDTGIAGAWAVLNQRIESAQGGNNNGFATGVSISADGLRLGTTKPGAARFQFWSRGSITAAFSEIDNFSGNSGVQSIVIAQDLAFIAGVNGVESYRETSPNVWTFVDNEVKVAGGPQFGFDLGAAGTTLIIGDPGAALITQYSTDGLGVMTFVSVFNSPAGAEALSQYGNGVAVINTGTSMTAVGEPGRDRLGLLDVGNAYAIAGL